jgi:putative ABC transport system permease protein
MRLWKRRATADFAAEIESHIAIEAERLREEGLSAAEAGEAARRKFGNILEAHERFYESRRILWLADFQKDARYALGVFRQSPVFAITVVVTLALGIGPTAAIFAVADAALIKPLPFPEAQRLVNLYERWQGELGLLAPADYLDYRREAKSFAELAAFREDPFNLGGQSRPERVRGAVVTPNFFSVFGVRPKLGRALDPLQDKPGDSRKAVVSYSLWQRRYAGSAGVIGKIVLVDGEPVNVIGVMPPGFSYPGDTELWMAARFQAPEHPLRPFTDPSASRESHYFDIVGRLTPAVAMRQAQAEMEVIARGLTARFQNEELADGPLLVSLQDGLVGNTRPAILILLAAVTVLLLIACANVANIVLARGTARQREIAIRGALGAGQWRLMRQLTVESLFLSLAGAVVGLAGASYALRSLEALLPADVVPAGGLHLDFRIIAFAAGTSILSAILFGLVPVIQAVEIDFSRALKEGGRSLTWGVPANLSRRILLVTQVALTAILLTGAALLIHSFDRLISAPENFNPEHVLSLQLSLAQAQYRSAAAKSRFATQMLEKIGALPGVHSTAITSRLPLEPGASRRGVEIKGRRAAPGGDISPYYLVISPDYFRTLQIAVLEGRAFTDRDAADAPGAVIINQAMARHFWPNEDPLGKLIRVDRLNWSPVVGVVADVAQQGIDRATIPAMYVPYAQDPWPALALVIRTGIDPGKIAAAATAAIQEIDKEQPVYNVRTMKEVVSRSVQARRFRTVLLSLFAILALMLAAVGTYGVMAYSVAQRTHEIGIRLALGAQQKEVRRLVIGEGLRLAGYGISLGLVTSVGLTRFLSGILYGVKSTDPASFVTSLSLLMFVSLLASYIPAQRAIKMDPANIFRAS